ncbi:PorP/SprF family type IX secretion system membrane protein [Polaribacter marinivivus]|uniref:Type IX secretion system membrane protein PorP/SprF n=1 Tax=Polaribacter marinivivus TaxID=1524260 RepID=A0ABV8RCL4_9FLAO
MIKIPKNKCILLNLKQGWFLLLFLVISNVYTQQLPNYTQYLYNMQVINPAFAGYRADLSISALSRDQWVGVPGAPTTRTFSVNARTSRGLGLGATFVSDKLGLSETTNINFDASYTLITSRYSRLAFGLKGGYTFFSNNLADGLTPDNDVYASTTGKFLNIGFGALFYNQKFYVGVSLPYLLETPQFYIQDNYNRGSLATHQNVFLSAGYLYEISENFMFKPTTMIRYTTNAPISVDINANVLYKESIEAGLSYRFNNSVSALFTLILNKKYRIGYAYDYKINNAIGNFNSHEFILHVDFSILRNTRWLRHNKCYF